MAETGADRLLPGQRRDPGRPQVNLALLLPRDATSIPLVRHLCEHALRELGCVASSADDVGLALTEACANVVRHAGPDESYTVEVRVADRTCEMKILDTGGLYVEADADESIRERARDAMSESGRGLAIIRALTDHFSFESRPETGTLLRMVKGLDFDEHSPARRLLIRTT
jgi:serine/threonine-protein kinase RsbW